MPAFLRRAAPLATAAVLLAAAAATLHVQAGAKDNPAASARPDARSIERGRYLARIAGCNDCHTPGYAQAGGKVDEKLWLTGDAVGWQGPWGTTYPANLRLVLAKMTEAEWVRVAKSAQYRPPMPWFALHDMTEADLRALYRYVRHLGPAGTPAPAYLPPGWAAGGGFSPCPAPPNPPPPGPGGGGRRRPPRPPDRPPATNPGTVMTETKIIAVVGATGAQGGGLVRAILEDPKGGFALDDPKGGFAVRALVRDPATPAARALAQAGAEVVAADVDDEASLARAFTGAWGAYCVTFFWAHFSPEKELVQAGNLARAARTAGIRHAVWSTLEDTRRWIPLESERMPTLMGRYKVPHFDAKGEADRLFTDAGVPTTFLLTSFYWDNLIHFGMGPKRGPDGTLAITMPMGHAKLPGIAAGDIGRCAYGVFKAGPAYIGRTVGIAGEHLTGAQMAEALARALGQPVRYQDVPPEVYRGFGFPGAEDLGNMFQFKRDFETDFCRARDVVFSRTLNPRLQDFAAWLAANAGRIPVE